MRRGVRKARVLLSVYFAYMVEYRAEILLWAVAMIFPIIMLGLWSQVAESGRFPLDAVEFKRYFLSMFIVRQLTVVWVIWEFENLVVEGRLSPYLLQPIDPVWRLVSLHLSERVARLPIAVGLTAFFFALHPEAWWTPGAGDVALALAAVAAAFALRFLIQYTLAMGCFWVERASAFEQVAFLAYLFLSGMIAPLRVYPPAVREFARLTPFPYMVDFPSTLLAGGEADPVRGFTVLGIWGVVLLAVNRWLWRRGLRQYSAMGA